jgi:hypothetical protein
MIVDLLVQAQPKGGYDKKLRSSQGEDRGTTKVETYGSAAHSKGMSVDDRRSMYSIPIFRNQRSTN